MSSEPFSAGPIAVPPAAVAAAYAGPSPAAILRRRALGHTGLMIGSGVLLIIFAMALLAPFLAPNDPYTQDLSRRLVTPIWDATVTGALPLGTEGVGRAYIQLLM